VLSDTLSSSLCCRSKLHIICVFFCFERVLQRHEQREEKFL